MLLLIFLLSFLNAQATLTTKEYAIYKSNDIRAIDFSEYINITEGIYTVELINVVDIQYNKEKKNAIEFCELDFSIISSEFKDETKTKTIFPKNTKGQGIDVSLCDNKLSFENNLLKLNKNNSIVTINHDKYNHLSCTLIFWITGKFVSSHDTGNINTDDNGVLREWYADNTIYIEYNYKNGIKHGNQRRWYKNGQQDISYHYTNGKLHGEQRRWYKDGKLKFITYYKNDKLDGLFKEWYANGQLKEIRNYTDDVLVEVLESYNEDGTKQ